MSDTLDLVYFGAWDGLNWIDITNPSPDGLVPAGSGNVLEVDLGIGGAMSGDVSADSIVVPLPFIGSDEFDDGNVETQFFLLSESDEGTANLLTLSGATLDSSGTLIVGQNTTLDLTDASSLVGPTGAGLKDFGDIEVSDGTVTADEMDVYATLDLLSGVGTFGTLVVGSYTAEGGFGGTGVLTIDAGGSIDVTDALVVTPQTGSGTIDINGGILTVEGDADLGLADSGVLNLTAGGSMSVAGAFNLGGSDTGTGTLSLSGGGSTLSAEGGLIIGDVGFGAGTIDDDASLGFDGALIVGATGTGTLTVSGRAIVGVLGQGAIEIGASAGATGGIGVSGTGSSLNGQVLAVGGTAAGAGGAGSLSIGLGGVVDVASATVWGTGAVLLSGGDLTASSITVDGLASGYGVLAGNLVDSGTIALTGGMLSLTGVVSGSGPLAFEGAATLLLGAPGTIGFSLPVTGLAGGDRIELGGLTIESAAVLSPGTITVATTTGAYRFTDVSFAPGASQVLTTGHDALTGEDYFQVACFVAGTRILTDHGEARVEDLRVGQRVVSAFGGCVPVVWLGHRHVRCDRHPRPREVWPVRVHADAFGAGMPRRDLLLSPDHAVYVDGALMPVHTLVNGATIVREPVDAVTYWHVELPAHDVILAEGLPAESYLDTGNRGAFANGGPAMALHPDFSWGIWDSQGCAGLVLDGGALAAARGALLNRAVASGHALTRDPALHVLANGRALHGEVTGRRHRFRLPARARGVRLVSRGAIPAETGIASDDTRRLGVAVAALTLDGTPLRLDDARLTSGWHALEAGDGAAPAWRWTDGEASLAIAGGRVLDVDIAMTERYWLEPRRAGSSRRATR